jgi:hypothetical protein
MARNKFKFMSVENILKQFIETLRSNLSQHNASGKLSDSLKYTIKFDGKIFSVSLRAESYLKYLEHGTKPHWPPVDAIREWIRVKPVLPRPLPNGQLPTREQLAFLIGRKISKYGTKPTHVLSRTKDKFRLSENVYKAFQSEYLRLMQEELHKTLN